MQPIFKLLKTKTTCPSSTLFQIIRTSKLKHFLKNATVCSKINNSKQRNTNFCVEISPLIQKTIYIKHCKQHDSEELSVTHFNLPANASRNTALRTRRHNRFRKAAGSFTLRHRCTFFGLMRTWNQLRCIESYFRCSESKYWEITKLYTLKSIQMIACLCSSYALQTSQQLDHNSKSSSA